MIDFNSLIEYISISFHFTVVSCVLIKFTNIIIYSSYLNYSLFPAQLPNYWAPETWTNFKACNPKIFCNYLDDLKQCKGYKNIFFHYLDNVSQLTLSANITGNFFKKDYCNALEYINMHQKRFLSFDQAWHHINLAYQNNCEIHFYSNIKPHQFVHAPDISWFAITIKNQNLQDYNNVIIIYNNEYYLGTKENKCLYKINTNWDVNWNKRNSF